MTNLVWIGFLASLAAGLATAVGALPILVGHAVSERTSNTMLGFAAGVMLAASFLSLIIPGFAAAEILTGHRALAALIVTGGMLFGALFVAALNAAIPHEHFIVGREGPDPVVLARVWLFVLAITIHNIPEGLAVGVGVAGGDLARGLALATGIGLQNAPEGLAVALALLSIGYARGPAFLIAGATGMVEPVAGLAGAYAVSYSQAALPTAMGFAAGAMIYVISHEIIPETHRHKFHGEATLGLMIGLATMMMLDMTLS